MITAEEVSKMLSPVLKQMSDLQKRVDAIQNLVNTSFNKACDNHATKNAEIQSLKADMIEFNNRLEQMRQALVTGKGVNRPATTLTAEDFAEMRGARIALASLSEIVELTEGKQ